MTDDSRETEPRSQPCPPDSARAEAPETGPPTATEEDLEQIGFDFGAEDYRTFALMGLLLISVFFALYFARAVFFPIILAIYLNLLLGPVVHGLNKLRVPHPIGAALVLAGLVGAAAVGVYYLSIPASNWLAKAPRTLDQLQDQFDGLKGPVQDLARASEHVEEATAVDGDRPQMRVATTPGYSATVLSATGTVIIDLIATLILLYFLLASGDRFLLKTVELMPRWREKRKVVEIVRSIQWGISTYLLSVTMINAGLGTVIAVIMWLFGMPNPVLWGVMAAIFNFIPYLGAICGTAIVALVALLSFPDTGYAVLVPIAYFACTSLEGSFITPTILGVRLDMNPVIIFTWLLFWGWLWGVAGAILAVPMLAAFKILCDQLEPLHPVGKYLVR